MCFSPKQTQRLIRYQINVISGTYLQCFIRIKGKRNMLGTYIFNIVCFHQFSSLADLAAAASRKTRWFTLLSVFLKEVRRCWFSQQRCHINRWSRCINSPNDSLRGCIISWNTRSRCVIKTSHLPCRCMGWWASRSAVSKPCLHADSSSLTHLSVKPTCSWWYFVLVAW